MKNRKLLAILTVVALTLTMLAPAALADTIKIGGLAPLTGEVAQYGIAVQEGVNLYIDQLNAAGGINGNTVEMIWYDQKGDVVEAINAFNLLVEKDKVSAIIGDVTSKPSIAVGELAAEIGIPMITASATAFDVTKDRSNYFRTCLLDPFQASTMADFALTELGAKKVAVLYDIGDDYSLGLAESFKLQAEKNGQEIVAYEAGSAQDVDFKSQLTNIAAKAPDALYVAYYYGPAALIVKQAAEVGLSTKFLGADGINGIENAIDDVALLDNAFYYSDHYAISASSEKALAFTEAFTAKYGKAPHSAFNGTAYDAAMVLCEAIKTVGSVENYADVVAAMKASAVEGVTGKIAFDENNNPIKSTFITTFVGGVQTFCKQVDPQ